MVVLPALEFETIMEELEKIDDIRLYDEAKNEYTGERMLFSDYLSSRKDSMPSYTIVVAPKAQKQLDKFPITLRP